LDADRFDALARCMHAASDRRLTRRGGIALAVAGFLLPTPAAAAGCKRQGITCKKPAECCSDVCQKPYKGAKQTKCWCKRLGEACASTKNCCEIPLMNCERRGRKRVCCSVSDEACRHDADCCAGLLCEGRSCVRCHDKGGSCDGRVGCCEGLDCDAGACIDLDGED
jgi:hypothetical protein